MANSAAATRADLDRMEGRLVEAFSKEVAKLATKEQLQTAIRKLAAHVGRDNTKLANKVHENGCLIEALDSKIQALSEGQANLEKQLVRKLVDLDKLQAAKAGRQMSRARRTRSRPSPISRASDCSTVPRPSATG